MAGIRIHHPKLRSVVLLVPHPGNESGRKPKDYRIHIDSEGDSIVSERVWQRLQEAKASGLSPHEFIVMNEVPDPPTLVMDNNKNGHSVQTVRQTPQGVSDDELLTIAQRFAPPGVNMNIKRSK